MNDKPKAWELYQEGVQYNQRLVPNQYDLVETNTEFFIGNQWLHLPNTPAMRGLPKPTFNILKRVSSLFIASLTSSGIALHYEPLAFYDKSGIEDPNHDMAEFTNAAVSNLLEKMNFDYKVREALFDGCQSGDYCAHFYFDPDAMPYGGSLGKHRGEIRMELVDGINVMFGNPNDCDVQSQPYVIIVGRSPVEQLRWEAKRFHNPVDNIQPDSDTRHMVGVGGKTEMTPGQDTGKALYALMYTKVTKMETKKDSNGEPITELAYGRNGEPIYEKDKNGNPVLDMNGSPIQKRKEIRVPVTTVRATKATQSAVIYEDIDTGLSLYPIAWGNWERQKNQYHGRALVTGLIPNQIFINSMFATAMRHMQLMAFPKTVYNADIISSWTNEVGQAIGVHGIQPGQSISTVAMNLQPAEMSNQIFTLIDKAMAYTKECLGATDAQMGNVKPDNTSALMVLQTNAEVPLENVRSGLYEWVEQIGAILPDMMGTYYGERPIVVEREVEDLVVGSTGVQIDPMTGMMKTQKIMRKSVEEFDFSKMKNSTLDMRIDVGATTYFSEIAMTQTLDNLRKDGTLDVIQYLERLPDKLIPKKQELIDQLRGRIADGTQTNANAGAAIPEAGSPVSGVNQGGGVSPDKAAQGLPGMAEAKLASGELPDITKKTLEKQGEMRL